MIKNIIFDMGNVILRWDPSYIASKITSDQDKRLLIENELFKSKEWQLLDQGLITVDEASELIKQRSNDEILIEALYHWYDYFEPFEAIIPLVKRLKDKDYKIYLLSNCSLQFDNYYHRVEAFKYFDGFYISAKHHLLKPDVKIYEHFLTTFSLKSEECIFIDDIEANVLGARKANIQAYLHNGNVDELDLFLKSILNY